MSAYGDEAMGIELRLELRGREAVGAGQFDVFDAEALDFVERTRDIGGELVAQAVKLQSNRPFERSPGACRCARSGGREGEKDGQCSDEGE